jgi:hypothetical protein
LRMSNSPHCSMQSKVAMTATMMVGFLRRSLRMMRISSPSSPGQDLVMVLVGNQNLERIILTNSPISILADLAELDDVVLAVALVLVRAQENSLGSKEPWRRRTKRLVAVTVTMYY